MSETPTPWPLVPGSLVTARFAKVHGDGPDDDTNTDWVAPVGLELTFVPTITGPIVWEPGVTGWREKVADDPDTGEPGIPDFVQPTGGHDAYQIGNRVRFAYNVWESTIANNVWSPADYPAGWILIN